MLITEEGYFVDYEVQEFIDHHGVKGQKWGIRNKRRTENFIQVGKGKGSPTQYARAAYNLGPIDLIKGRGVKGGSRRKGARQRKASNNFANGKATTRNLLTRLAAVRQQDIIPTSKSSKNTSAAVGASIAGAILISVGQTAIKNMIKKA